MQQEKSKTTETETELDIKFYKTRKDIGRGFYLVECELNDPELTHLIGHGGGNP